VDEASTVLSLNNVVVEVSMQYYQIVNFVFPDSK